jgi:DNA-binding PadR family transcriptional regulator
LGALGFAILGLLAREPLSGYDVAGRMRERVGYFWSARHSQIYPELARLEGAGMVEHRVVEQDDRPDKKVYEVTEAGLAALKAWVVQAPKPQASRDELVLKAHSVWLADPAEAVALFREQQRLHEEQLRHYEGLERWMKRDWGADIEDPRSPLFATYATLRRGLGYERGTAEWCGWVAKSLEAGKRQGPGRKG